MADRDLAAPTAAPPLAVGLDADELAFIGEAAAYLEQPSFTMRATRVLGRPVEALVARLPAAVHRASERAGEAALRRALAAAVVGLPRRRPHLAGLALRERIARTRDGALLRSATAGAAGVAGGIFGGATLVLELGTTTLIILRGVADIAVMLDADLDDPAERLECLAVFALGSGRAGAGGDDPSGGSAYYAARVGLHRAAGELGKMVAGAGAEELARRLLRSRSPAVAQFVGKIASRYGAVAGQKGAMQLLPLVGAASAAALNLAFLRHYHQVARYHFGLRWLERRVGTTVVRARYEEAAQALATAPRRPGDLTPPAAANPEAVAKGGHGGGGSGG